jgi:tyrosine-protein kinase Etk/Wzc
LKYHEMLFEFLSKQFEAARLDEAKDSVVVQVVDAAVEPERKSGPMRLAIVALLTASSFLGAIGWVLVGDRIKDKFSQPEISRNHPRPAVEQNLLP